MIDPEFFQPRQNPWGLVGGALITALAPLLLKRVRIWIIRKWSARRTTNNMLLKSVEAMKKLMETQTEELARITKTCDTLQAERYESRRQYTILLALVSSEDHGQFLTDATGLVTWTNRRFQRWTSRSAVDLERRGIFTTLVAEHQTRFRVDFLTAIQDGYEFRGDYALRVFDQVHGFQPMDTEWLVEPVRDTEGDNEVIFAWIGNVRPSKSAEAQANLRRLIHTGQQSAIPADEE